MTLLLVAPVALPMAAAMACLVAWRRPRIQRAIALAGVSGLLLSGILLLREVLAHGILVEAMGGWRAPFGIVFVADSLAALMVLVAGVISLACVVSLVPTASHRAESLGTYPLVLAVIAGTCGAFLTGDLFNLYVWFEVLLMASFALIALGGGRARTEGAIKYVVLNLFASALFLAGVGVLYGVAGTVNMADLSVRLPALGRTDLAAAVSLVFLVSFGIKAGLFPLFFWLPASYPTLSAPVGGLFAGLLTKVGVYALIRVFTLVFPGEPFALQVLLAVSGLTMVTGVLGALAQNEIRRILSFHIVSQIGFMTLGLALHTPLALAGTVFYVIHHILVKTNLFLVGGLVHRLRGSSQLPRVGGLWGTHPLLGLLFLVPAFSLVGAPPFSGFWAKLILLQASLQTGEAILVLAMLFTSFFTLLSMSKIWMEAFWKPTPPGAAPHPPPRRVPLALHAAPVAGLALLTLLLGLYAEGLLAICLDVARELLDPTDYVRAVLGGAPP